MALLFLFYSLFFLSTRLLAFSMSERRAHLKDVSFDTHKYLVIASSQSMLGKYPTIISSDVEELTHGI